MGHSQSAGRGGVEDGSIFKTVEYFYDEAGVLLSEREYTSTNIDGNTHKYFYDEKGRLTDKTYNFGSGAGPHIIYSYDTLGNMVEETHQVVLPSIGFRRTIYKYSFDAHGLASQKQWIGSDGNLIETSIFRYDSHNNLVEELKHNADDKFTASVLYKFDKQGLLIGEIRSYDRSRQPWMPSLETVLYTYEFY